MPLTRIALALLLFLGAPDSDRGEVPVAVVVIADGHDRDAVITALRAQAEQTVANYKRPVRYLVEAGLPRDDTGKLLRRQVRDAMWGDDSPFAVSRG